MSNKPNLSKLAYTEWDPQSEMEVLASLDNSTVESVQKQQQGLQDMPKVRETAAPQSNPSFTPSPGKNDGTDTDSYKEMERLLDEKVISTQAPKVNKSNQNHGPNGNITNVSQDSGTVSGMTSAEYTEAQKNKNQDTEAKENPFVIALELLRELDLLHVKDEDLKDPSLDTLFKLARDKKNKDLQDAVDLVRGEVEHDPFMVKMFDYATQGRGFTDIPAMAEAVGLEKDFTQVDLNDTVQQKELYVMFLQDGKNPANPQDRAFLNVISNLVNSAIEDGTLKEKAEEARSYYIKEQRERQNKLMKEAADKRKKEHENALKAQEEDRRWFDKFKQSLINSKWDKGRKESVMKEFDSLQTPTGDIEKSWIIKHDFIMNDPELFKFYLNFLSYFDLNTGHFSKGKNNVHVQQSSVNYVQKLLSNISKKENDSDSKSTQTNVQRPGSNIAENNIDPTKDGYYR